MWEKKIIFFSQEASQGQTLKIKFSSPWEVPDHMTNFGRRGKENAGSRKGVRTFCSGFPVLVALGRGRSQQSSKKS